MLSKVWAFCGLIAAAAAVPAAGQSEKSTLVASNGVSISLNADEFADRYEYTAPDIEIPESRSVAWVGRVKVRGEWLPLQIGGLAAYQGDWRYYDQAILRGGEELTAHFTDRSVISCAGSSRRYGQGCLLSESFMILPTRAQIERYAEDGVLAVQIRSRRGQSMTINVPLDYVAALDELTGDANQPDKYFLDDASVPDDE